MKHSDFFASCLHDPFHYYGMHSREGTLHIRTFQPHAHAVSVLNASTGERVASLIRRENSDIFELQLPKTPLFRYQFAVDWPLGRVVLEDPYRFWTWLGDLDAWLLAEGRHLHAYERLGAHPMTIDDVAGTVFAVWAPNAQQVSVIGQFNYWDERYHPMRFRAECGVWELFIPAVNPEMLYKFSIIGCDGIRRQKADPYAFAGQLRPDTASQVTATLNVCSSDAKRYAGNAVTAPISIYEVHLGSWRRHYEGNRWLSYRELADTLLPYVQEMGFTHIELLPINEHPFDGSWGYQPLGLFAPTSRFGTPADFKFFVERAHQLGLKVIIDWVPGHFPEDEHGLTRFDGTCLYEHNNPLEGRHQDWGTLIYNFGRREVRNFLISNALYWAEYFDIDGLRVDAVASMLYRDYSRQQGQWIPNQYGGNENLEAIEFLRELNTVLGRERPELATFAEESTSFDGVSRPTSAGGLGFHYKWNMGWMNDTLSYLQQDPIYRSYHHHQMTFAMAYAYSEQFVLPISHDEVVHGKGSLIQKMFGDYWQKFANLRAFYGFMWAHPGKKLLFMGCEFAQFAEWNHDVGLDWHLLDYSAHAGVRHLVGDLNQLYKAHPALWEGDSAPYGFQWVNADDHTRSVLSFMRYARSGDSLLVVSHFTPVLREGFRIGVPHLGRWRVILNTDAACYGGANAGLMGADAEEVAWDQHPYSLVLTVPPLATLYLIAEQIHSLTEYAHDAD